MNDMTPALPEIRTLVPHAGTMMLLDRLLAVGQETLCAEVRIGADTLFCDGARVGGWVGVEYMAQAVAAFAGYHARQLGQPVKIGFLLGARRYECGTACFALGSVLHVSVKRALQGENGLGAFECRIDDAAKPADAALASATITVFQPDSAAEFLQNTSNESAV